MASGLKPVVTNHHPNLIHATLLTYKTFKASAIVLTKRDATFRASTKSSAPQWLSDETTQADLLPRSGFWRFNANGIKVSVNEREALECGGR
jgi:hypothetical protein